jgi:uncharacterized protein (DUF934 family)
MPRLIKNGTIVEDRWTLLREIASLAELSSATPVIVPLALWKVERAALAERGEVGVWLKPDDDPEALADDVATLTLIAIDFPKFTDGRGYSIAQLLRTRYRYAGELRAIGDVLRDQLYYMRECGFDAFSVRPDRSLEDALSAFADFSDGYQATVREPRPLFRRRMAAGPVRDHLSAASDPS